MATLEGSGSQVRLGVSPLSWTNDVLVELGGDVPLEVCLQDAVEIDYQGVELGRKFPRNSEDLLQKLSSYGLQLATGWHSGFLSERSVEAGGGSCSVVGGLRLPGSCLWRLWNVGRRFSLGRVPESKDSS